MMKYIKKFVKENIEWFILFLSLILFIAILEDVFDAEIMEFDIWGYKLITGCVSPFMTLFFKVVTEFGGALVLILICIFALIFIKNKKIGIFMSLNLSLISLFNVILKNIIARERPHGFNLIDETGYSFPSGHSMASAAFYGFIIYLVYKYVKNKYLKWTLIFLFSILIALIGISRIYLGVHYISDVIAGFLISISYLVIFIKVFKFKSKRK